MNKYLMALLLSIMAIPAMADNSGMQQLNRFVEQVKTFQAQFQQTVLDQNGNVLEQAEGQFHLNRPGKFRWDYQEPYPQQIVADGNKIWFYDEDLEQVTVKSQQEALAETPASLLSGDFVPADKYDIRPIESKDGLNWIELKPKQDEANFQMITLAFDKGALKQMIMRDSFDQRTRLIFSQVKENPSIGQKTFQFTPPAGVDVVGE